MKKVIKWADYDHLLGTMPDRELARRIGCSGFAVISRRVKFSIPAFVSQEYRICPICKNIFIVFISSRRSTCSPACRRKNHAKIRVGKCHPWKSEKAIATIEKKKAKGFPKEVSDAAVAAIKKSPRTGAFETNRSALYWKLEDPKGNIYEFRNLALWCRNNAHLFGMEPGKSKNISAGFGHVKLSMQGKSSSPVNSYKEWRLIEWSAVTEETYSARETAEILGVSESTLPSSRIKGDQLSKALVQKDGEARFYKSRIDALAKENKKDPLP